MYQVPVYAVYGGIVIDITHHSSQQQLLPYAVRYAMGKTNRTGTCWTSSYPSNVLRADSQSTTTNNNQQYDRYLPSPERDSCLFQRRIYIYQYIGSDQIIVKGCVVVD